MRQRWEALVEEWRNRRGLRLGTFAIAGIFWLYGLLVWQDGLQAASIDLQHQARQLARLQAESRTAAEWAERAQLAEAQLAAVEAPVKSVETLGLAQADLQDWLGGAVQRAGLANAAVVVAAATTREPRSAGNSADAGAAMPPEHRLGLAYIVRAQVRADFAPLAAYDLLAAIEGGERRIWIETLAIRQTPTPRIELSVLAAYRQKPRAGT